MTQRGDLVRVDGYEFVITFDGRQSLLGPRETRDAGAFIFGALRRRQISTDRRYTDRTRATEAPLKGDVQL